MRVGKEGEKGKEGGKSESCGKKTTMEERHERRGKKKCEEEE